MLKYVDFILETAGLQKQRTKKILQVNPTAPPVRTEPEEIKIKVYDYDFEGTVCKEFSKIEEIYPFLHSPSVTWINVDGLRKRDIESVCEHFGIHPLIAEDILSIGQRPKSDDINGIMYVLLYMLSFNDQTQSVEQEQISIILGQNFVISFQEESSRDPFNLLRDRLNVNNSKLRQNKADYLFYSLLDYIVDHYFSVMERMGDKIESLEEEIIKKSDNRSLVRINSIRKEMILLKRIITPVREVIGSLMRSDTNLIEDKTLKYFKDVYDHIVQASDLSENYRDMMMNMQDLYLSNVNLRLNEVMKVMAIVTCLLAPATVIGGIFGMNFDIIPLLHNEWGFAISVALMLIIPLVMIRIFKRRGWFSKS